MSQNLSSLKGLHGSGFRVGGLGFRQFYTGLFRAELQFFWVDTRSLDKSSYGGFKNAGAQEPWIDGGVNGDDRVPVRIW